MRKKIITKADFHSFQTFCRHTKNSRSIGRILGCRTVPTKNVVGHDIANEISSTGARTDCEEPFSSAILPELRSSVSTAMSERAPGDLSKTLLLMRSA